MSSQVGEQDDDDQEMIQMNEEGGTELNSDFLEDKEKKEWERLNSKFGSQQFMQQQKRSNSTTSSQILFGNGLKKRDGKAAEKDQAKQDKLEKDSQRSG